MTSFKFSPNPDQQLHVTKRFFATNDRIIQVLSFLATGLLIYDIGYVENEPLDDLFYLYTVFVFCLGVGYTLRVYSKSFYLRTSQVLFELIVAILLVVVAIANLGAVFWNETALVMPLLGRSLLLIIFVAELSQLSLGITQVRAHPALVFILSFLLLILIGAGMLSLPNATTHGISFVDALFTSTSAVCVTGLIVLDTSSDFTFLGQVIIITLIQIGGLGFMTFTSFFGFFFKGSFSLKSQLFLKDYINEENIGAISATLVKIVLFTFLVEAVGAVFIFSFLDTDLFETTGDHLFFSIFHSISAFCNAGFSTLEFGLYEAGFRTAYDVHLVIGTVIIIGGIGFPVVMGYYGYLKHVLIGTQRMVMRHEAYRHVPRVANINIRLSLYTTAALLVFGFVAFYLFENEHSLKGLSWYGKLVTSFFGSVTPRTAGFNTVDMNAMVMPTVLIYLLLMWVGASPGSTGGGIKTTTFSVALLNILSLAKGRKRVEIFHRRINSETLQKAFAVIALSHLTIGCGTFLVLWFNPELQLKDVVFEIFSAFATVGLSLGITADLSVNSKLVVAFVMFLGRVGTVTFLVAFFRKTRALNYKLPGESVNIT